MSCFCAEQPASASASLLAAVWAEGVVIPEAGGDESDERDDGDAGDEGDAGGAEDAGGGG